MKTQADVMAPAVREAWIRVVPFSQATGDLARAYEDLKSRGSSRPAVYHSPGGEPPNIIRCHGLDPDGLRLAFGMSAVVHWGPRSLAWQEREMLNTVTSAANNCFY